MVARKGVICLGTTVVDVVLEVEEIPREPLKIFAKSRVRRGGGPASTGAVACAHLGLSTELWSWFGADSEGDFLTAMLERHGVDTTHTLRSADFDTVTAYVMVDHEGERLIVAYGTRVTPGSTAHLPLNTVAEAGAVLVDSAWREGAADVLDAARASGTPAVLDAESHDVERLIDLAKRASYPVFSEEGFVRVARGAKPGADSCRGIAEILAAPIGVTLGSKGSFWWVDDEFTHIPALDVVVRDTTGAGDVFHGAIAAGLAEGLSLLQSARLGTAIAALKCQRGDGWDGTPDRPDVERMLRRL
jgi:sulfofructose kinase